jgi:hypothetical protein
MKINGLLGLAFKQRAQLREHPLETEVLQIMQLLVASDYHFAGPVGA